MNSLQIGRKRFSRWFWKIVDTKTESAYLAEFEDLSAMQEHQQVLRLKADYKTGSLEEQDVEDVYRLIKFFDPAVIAEVGTFIGVSTLAMRLAAPNAVIHTCDVSNEIDISPIEDDLLFQYPKKTSVEMFRTLADKGVKVDLIYLDGRLSQDDFEPLTKIAHEKTVFVLDDFEGIEKGVNNAMMLEGPGRLLIYPRTFTRAKTAISLPLSLVQIVPQEAT
jgi:predicted O-methyltransferase YrrM